MIKHEIKVLNYTEPKHNDFYTVTSSNHYNT